MGARWNQYVTMQRCYIYSSIGFEPVVALHAQLYLPETWQLTGPHGHVCAPWLSESNEAADKQISPWGT